MVTKLTLSRLHVHWRFDRFMATHARQVPPPVKTAHELDAARGPDRTTRQQPAEPAPFGRPSAETVGSHHDVPLAASSSPMGGRGQRWPAPRLHGTRGQPSGAVIAWRTTRLAPPGASGCTETKLPYTSRGSANGNPCICARQCPPGAATGVFCTWNDPRTPWGPSNALHAPRKPHRGRYCVRKLA